MAAGTYPLASTQNPDGSFTSTALANISSYPPVNYLSYMGKLTLGNLIVTGTTVAKSLGNPANVPGSPCCGDPIAIATGNLFEQVTDYTTAGQNNMVFARYYNSLGSGSVFASTLGRNWRSTYDRYLHITSSSAVYAERPDGQIVDFGLTGGTWTTDSDIDLKLAKSGATWILTDHSDTIETYTDLGNGQAILSAIQYRDGYTQNLQYNTNNQLVAVADSYGRSLQLTYQAGLLASVTAPDGLVISYGYTESSGLYLLASVTYSAAKAVTQNYLYENTTQPFTLTGIIDEDGNRFATWTYDSLGRATSSQHAGGVDLTAVAYNDSNGSRTVTNALGEQEIYKFTTLQGAPKVSEIDRLASAGVAAATRKFSYDVNGYLASSTDYDGNVTTYTHDARGDETSRTEPAGTALARTTTTTWLPTLHLPTSITEPGRVTNLTYDANGNLLGRTVTAGPLNRSWAYTYNGTGEVQTATDPRGNVTTFTYDSTGDIATITDALSHVTSLTSYDANGRPLSITDPNGLVATLAYNFRGEVTSRNVGGEITTYAYDPVGQLTKTTRPDGSYLAFTYDSAHRLTGITSSVGDDIAYTYDPASNVTEAQLYDPSGNLAQTQSYTYDPINRLAEAIGAHGQTTAYAYDPNSNLTGITDPLSHNTAYRYDALNRTVQVIDPKGGATDYAYDALDHLTAVTDPRDLITGYAWDGLDDQTAVTSPDSGVTARSFDTAGNIITSTDARGLATFYQYDALNRPVQATYADGSTTIWQYDQGINGVGHLTTMSDLSGMSTWTYDQHGRVLTKAQTTGGMTFATARSYDGAGRLASLTYPSGAVITISYDAAGRISTLNSGRSAVVSGVTYFPFGPAETWRQGNGSIYSRSFDQDGRIVGIGFGGGTIALAYDPASRITGITETSLPNKSFGYDELDRLTRYTSGSTTLSYGYDANGNRTSLGAGNTATSYTIDPGSNRLVGSTGPGTRGLSYDATGNVTTDSQPLINYAYAYDASGRLVTAKTGGFATSYANDGLGERVTRSGYGASSLPSSSERFVYDQSGQLLGEYDGSGNAIQETVWLGDLPVAVLIPGMAPFSTAPDHLGSPHQIANGAGSAVWLWDHDPFGNGSPTGSLTYNLRFPGQYYDQETGLHYNGFRDYDPSSGRYVQSDPIGLAGGVNTYVYVDGNPVRVLDPLGLQPLLEGRVEYDEIDADCGSQEAGLSGQRGTDYTIVRKLIGFATYNDLRNDAKQLGAALDQATESLLPDYATISGDFALPIPFGGPQIGGGFSQTIDRYGNTFRGHQVNWSKSPGLSASIKFGYFRNWASPVAVLSSDRLKDFLPGWSLGFGGNLFNGLSGGVSGNGSGVAGEWGGALSYPPGAGYSGSASNGKFTGNLFDGALWPGLPNGGKGVPLGQP